MREDFNAMLADQRSGNRGLGSAAALLCAILLSSLFVPPASAVTRVLTSRIGPGGTEATVFTTPQKVAFDGAGERAYVFDSGVNKIFGFDVSTPGVFTPLTGNFPLAVPASGNGRGLAVDNTALPSAGNIYYVPGAAADAKLYGYTSAGVPLGGNFPVTVPGATSEVAVDSTGHVWVVDKTAKKVRRYSSAGVEEGTPVDVESLVGGNINTLANIDFDNNDDLYYNAFQGPVYRLNAPEYTTSSQITPTALPSTRALEVEQGTAYLGREETGNRRIEARNGSGALLYEFGNVLPPSGASQNQNYVGVAINPSTDEIYAVDLTRFKQLMVFSELGDPPTVAIAPPATGLTGTHATLHGTVNANGTVVSECKFEYGLTTSYGASVPCSGSIPADSSPHPVSAALTNIKPQSNTYHYRIVAKNALGTVISGDGTFVTPDTFLTGSASSIGISTAILNGSVNPDGVALTDCRFEYGISTSYGSTAPCSPAAGAIPADAVPHPVSLALTGLTGNTNYHFRISATTAAGTFVGADQTFETLGVPQIVTQAVSPVDGSSATLYTEVNPRGFNTNYRFEYGKTPAYGMVAPADFEFFAGSGTVPVKGSVKLSGLEGDTTYHYRLVASSSAGTTRGPDQTFTTRFDPGSCPNAALRATQISDIQPAGSTALGSCMALEMVSPPQKTQHPVKFPSVSADGGHVVFINAGALAETKGVEEITGDAYVAARAEDGWSTTPTILRHMRFGGMPQAYAADFSSWFQFVADDQAAEFENTAFISSLNGRTSVAFSPLLTAPEGPPAPGEFAGVSADVSRLYIRTKKAGTPTGQSSTDISAGYLPGDPKPSPLGMAFSNTYVAARDGGGSPEPLQLLARDSLGKVWGGNCGTTVGGHPDPSRPLGQINERVRVQGAIANDGSRVYFSTRPSQPASGACSSANGMRILERTETSTGVEISEFIENECTRVAPPCDATEGNDNFEGASADGSKVFFTTTRQLVDSDLDTGSTCGSSLGQATGCDLYLYEKLSGGGHNLIQVSKGDATNPTPGSGAKVLSGVAAISTDGSHVYFAAEGVLTTAANRHGARAQPGKPNLYLYQRDAANPTGRTSFIGTLASGDSEGLWGGSEGFTNGAYPVPAMGPDGKEIGGDGHILLFKSKAQLTGNDADGSRRDVYRYDSETGSIQCLSCLAGGSSANVDVNVSIERDQLGIPLGPDFASKGRWVSEDGDSVVFATAESLLPGDSNGVAADYLWHDGQLQRLPGSAVSAGGIADFPTISGDGSTVAFLSRDRLLPQDGDGVADAYVLRSNGGFPIPPPDPDCAGEACQEPFRAQSAGPTAASEAASGGNVREVSRARCKKGFVRRKGRCVKRHHRKKHHRQAGKQQHGQENRAASNRPGGHK